MALDQPHKSSEPITVLIIEDQTAIRELLAVIVGTIPGFVVVGEAGDVAEALRITAEKRPCLIVLDWVLASGSGLEYLRSVRAEAQPHVLVFSANTTELAVRESLDAGARGYLEKTAGIGEFVRAIHAVGSGLTYLGPAITQCVRRIALQADRVEESTDLTLRERQVLRLIAEGCSSKQIAEKLELSIRTVENHRARIARRTGLHSVAQLALHAARLGLIDQPPLVSRLRVGDDREAENALDTGR